MKRLKSNLLKLLFIIQPLVFTGCFFLIVYTAWTKDLQPKEVMFFFQNFHSTNAHITNNLDDIFSKDKQTKYIINKNNTIEIQGHKTLKRKLKIQSMISTSSPLFKNTTNSFIMTKAGDVIFSNQKNVQTNSVSSFKSVQSFIRNPLQSYSFVSKKGFHAYTTIPRTNLISFSEVPADFFIKKITYIYRWWILLLISFSTIITYFNYLAATRTKHVV